MDSYKPEGHHAMFDHRMWLATRGSKLLRLAMVFDLPHSVHRELHRKVKGELPPDPTTCYTVLEQITAPANDICRLDQAIHTFDDLSLSANTIDRRRKAGRMAEFLYRQRPFIVKGQDG